MHRKNETPCPKDSRTGLVIDREYMFTCLDYIRVYATCIRKCQWNRVSPQHAILEEID
jgi:hypothetical protein